MYNNGKFGKSRCLSSLSLMSTNIHHRIKVIPDGSKGGAILSAQSL